MKSRVPVVAGSGRGGEGELTERRERGDVCIDIAKAINADVSYGAVGVHSEVRYQCASDQMLHTCKGEGVNLVSPSCITTGDVVNRRLEVSSTKSPQCWLVVRC